MRHEEGGLYRVFFNSADACSCKILGLDVSGELCVTSLSQHSDADKSECILLFWGLFTFLASLWAPFSSSLPVSPPGGADAAGENGTQLESAVLRGVLHLRYIVQGYHVRQKLPALIEILTTSAYQQAIVFVNAADRAAQVAGMLSQAGIAATSSSGKMEQAWRTQALVGLKQFQFRVIVCTDLFARGIDAERVNVVVNLELPTEKDRVFGEGVKSGRGSISRLAATTTLGTCLERPFTRTICK